jgi:hypothetical protein
MIGRFAVMWLLLSCALLASCRGERGTSEFQPPTPGTSAVVVDTLEGEAGSPIGRPSGIDVDPDGRLWIADALSHEIQMVDLASGETSVIGREGQGPGEFLRPEAVTVREGMIRVVEFRSRRIQILTASGTFVSAEPINSMLLLPLSLGSRGEIATSVLGQRGALAAYHPAEGGEPRYVGQAPAPPPTSISQARLREQIQTGEIPSEFLNNVLPVVREGGGLWLVTQGDGRVLAFAGSGEPIWERDLPEPYVTAARARFFQAWAATPVEGVPVPWMARGGASFRGDLWLLVDAPTGEGSHLLVYEGDTGRLTRVEHLPLRSPGWCLAVDPVRPEKIFVCLPEEAIVVGIDLSGSPGADPT